MKGLEERPTPGLQPKVVGQGNREQHAKDRGKADYRSLEPRFCRTPTTEHLSRHGNMGIAETLMKEFERWNQIPPEASVETEGSEDSFDYEGGLHVTG